MNSIRVLLVVAVAAFGAASSRIETRAVQQPASSKHALAGEAAAQILCTTCHRLPPPDILPRSAWPDEIARMFLIQINQPEPTGPPGTSARLVRLPADWQSIARYYEVNAPEQLAQPGRWPEPDQTPMFRKRVVGSGAANPAVANIRLVDLDGDRRPEIVLADMRNGVVLKASSQAAKPAFIRIAGVSNPAHIEPIDLDRDGTLDLLVADLGRFLPSDHRDGAVVLLRGRPDGTYLTTKLEGWPRVSDVEPADFDGDGDLDLAVAAFGWRRTGEVTILKNETVDYDKPSFAPHQIDKRAGSIHAVPVDLNKDRKPDLVTLFAQEHETVVAFVNRGEMHFAPQVIYTAPHPGWGSSGIQVVDLDEDGDSDVLMTNGDTFDDHRLKPYHGIRWLENTGTYPFAEHTLATLAAAHRAQAVDLDADGDLDIVACALLASSDPQAANLPSVVWLEQTRRGVFERHVLEVGLPTHATLDTLDFDNDGDIDIVVGNFTVDTTPLGIAEIFENLRVRK
jgi:hypothetical protein